MDCGSAWTLEAFIDSHRIGKTASDDTTFHIYFPIVVHEEHVVTKLCLHAQHNGTVGHTLKVTHSEALTQLCSGQDMPHGKEVFRAMMLPRCHLYLNPYLKFFGSLSL